MFTNGGAAAPVVAPYVLKYSEHHPSAFGVFPQQVLYQPTLGTDKLLGIDIKIFESALIDFPRGALVNGHTIPTKDEIIAELGKPESIEYQQHLLKYSAIRAENFNQEEFNKVLPAMELQRILREYLAYPNLSDVQIANILDMTRQHACNPGNILIGLYKLIFTQKLGLSIGKAYGLHEHEISCKLSIDLDMKTRIPYLKQEYYIGYQQIVNSDDEHFFFEPVPGTKQPMLTIKIVAKIPLVKGYSPIMQEIIFTGYHPEIIQKLPELHGLIMQGEVVNRHKEGLQQALTEWDISISTSKHIVELGLRNLSRFLAKFNRHYAFTYTTLANETLLAETKQHFFDLVCAKGRAYELSPRDDKTAVETKIKTLLLKDDLTEVEIGNICYRCNLKNSNPGVKICNILKKILEKHDISWRTPTVISTKSIAARDIEIALLSDSLILHLEQKFHIKFLQINHHGILKSATDLGGMPGATVLEIFIYCHIPLIGGLPNSIELKKFSVATECPVLIPALEQLKWLDFGEWV